MPHAHRLALTVTDAPGVLERIVSICRSRQCTIVSLRFRAGDRHRPGLVELTLDGSVRMTRLTGDRLARLLDVLTIEQVDGAGSSAAPTGAVADLPQMAAARD